MVGEEFKKVGFDDPVQAVQFNALTVIDINRLLLSNGKILIVMQPPRIPNGFP